MMASLKYLTWDNLWKSMFREIEAHHGMDLMKVSFWKDF